uniref:Uncharacterized protein n=1 Tax=Anopheles atroparvus TaxID=41427 RepID=A0A182JM76_ANOAO
MPIRPLCGRSVSTFFPLKLYIRGACEKKPPWPLKMLLQELNRTSPRVLTTGSSRSAIRTIESRATLSKGRASLGHYTRTHLPRRKESPKRSQETGTPGLAIAREVSAADSLHVTAVRFVKCGHPQLEIIDERTKNKWHKQAEIFPSTHQQDERCRDAQRK